MYFKNREYVHSLFTILKTAGFDIKHAIIDFELGLKNGLSVSFPNININYCNFHFGQCIWRKIQSIGMSGIYNENAEF
jgi:hypothetical protein